MTASATTVLVGDIVDFTIVVSSIRTRDVHNATMKFRTNTFGTPLRMDSATVPGGSCTFVGGEARCALGDIAAGASRTITVRTTAVGVGVGPAGTGDGRSKRRCRFAQQRSLCPCDRQSDPGRRVRRGHAEFFLAVWRAVRIQDQSAIVRRAIDRQRHASSSRCNFRGDPEVDSVTIGGVACAPNWAHQLLRARWYPRGRGNPCPS